MMRGFVKFPFSTKSLRRTPASSGLGILKKKRLVFLKESWEIEGKLQYLGDILEEKLRLERI